MARRRKSTSRKKGSSHFWSKLLLFLLLLILGVGFGIWKYPTTARQWVAVIVVESVLTNPELAEARRVILYAADFYRRHKEFLFDGAMLSPEGFECAEHTVLFHGRMIFTKPAEDKRIESIQPSVLHSVWQSPQGGKALFLANYTEQEQRWKYGEKSGTLAAHELRMIPL